jgi:hypothetical protein
VEKGQAASCRAISWLGGRSRRVRKIGKVASRCRTNQRLEGSAAARRGRCQGGDERDGAREGETRGTSHRLSGGRGRAARRVVAGASIEVGVTKCVRVWWEDNAVCRGRRGDSRLLIVVQSGEGGAKPHRAGQTQRGSAPRRRLQLISGTMAAVFGSPLTLFLTALALRRPRDRKPLFLGSCSQTQPLSFTIFAGP